MTYRPQRIAETEAAVAKALITLSMDEREKVYEDIHGVAPVVDEDTECINDLLLQLDKKVQQNMTSIYKTALSMSKDYVEDRAFRLMFLRAESYDVSAACNRLMNFLEFKLTLFGQEKLTEEITLEDFGQEDIKMFSDYKRWRKELSLKLGPNFRPTENSMVVCNEYGQPLSQSSPNRRYERMK